MFQQFVRITLFVLVCALLGFNASAQSKASDTDTVELQNQLKRTAAALVVAEQKADRLKTNLDIEKARILETDVDRQINKETITKLNAEIKETQETQRQKRSEFVALKQKIDQALAVSTRQREEERAKEEALAQAQAARLVADNEAAARRQAEEEAAQKTISAQREAAVDADMKRKAADKAKQKADEEARKRADVDALAEAERKNAESTETALRFTQADRQRIQIALTSLGFDTRGTDGVFGPRSREMIANWQKARKQPVTGYLNSVQQQAVLKEAGPALSKYDDEQKKIGDDKKKADDEAKRKAEEAAKANAVAVTPPPVSSSAAPASSGAQVGQYDGTWRGDINDWSVALTITGSIVKGIMSCQNSPVDFEAVLEPGGSISTYASNAGRRIQIQGKLPTLFIAKSWHCAGGSGTLTRGGK